MYISGENFKSSPEMCLEISNFQKKSYATVSEWKEPMAGIAVDKAMIIDFQAEFSL